MVDVTVICLVRHGYATSAVTVQNLYATTDVPFRLIFADIGSPQPVQDYLEGEAATRPGFTHLRFNNFRSRQRARIEAMALVETPFVVLVDNNMLFDRGWLENLLQAQQETGADIVSPLIVTQGGDIHFSAGRVVRERKSRWSLRRQVIRPHQQPGVKPASNLSDARLRRFDIDFAESHCCLALTESLRLPGVLEEAMHNAHTTAYASYMLKFKYGKRLVLEPSSVVSMAPICFGYDLPWVCSCYMDIDLLYQAYRRLEGLIGKGPGTDLNLSLEWHAHHFKFLLLSLLEGNRLERQDLMDMAEVPDYIRGYDHSLPDDTDQRLRNGVLPYIKANAPDLLDLARLWLGEQPPRFSRDGRLVAA